METPRLKTSEILISLLALIILRVIVEDILSYYFSSYTRFVMQGTGIGFYLALIYVSKYLLTMSDLSFVAIFGSKAKIQDLITAMLWTSILLLFSLGSIFLFIFIYAHFDLGDAYKLAGFHAAHIDTLGSGAEAIAYFLVLQCIFSPIAEELFFRGLLMRALTVRYGYAIAVLINSALFALLHFSHIDYFGTFVFAVVLSVLYAKTGSLFLPIIIHSFYNLCAYLQQDLFDSFWVRTKNELTGLSHWLPEIGFLFISTLSIGWFIWKNWSKAGARYEIDATKH